MTFSKSMAAATVNNLANYSLRDSNGNVYTLSSPSYTSGLTATYSITNGPLPSGNYTFTISSAVTDATGNPLPAYTLNFSVFRASPGTVTPLVTPTSQPDGSFSPIGTYSTSGINPLIASAALRGSGHPLDLVALNYFSNTISVLLGNGNGTFQSPVTYVVGSNPQSVAFGDLNRDGKVDIAVSNFGSNNVSILYGNGDGTFQSSVNIPVAGNAHGVAIADLDGKHGNDLVVADYGSNEVSVLLNQGGGVFATAVNYSTGNGPSGLAIADLNGDGKLDIAVGNYNDNTLSVLPGNGDGTFGTRVNFNVGASPQNLVVADLNGDHKLDLATANYDSNNVSVLLNQGTAGAAVQSSTFADAVNYSSGGGSNPYDLVATDLNGDGKLDLAVANSGSNQVGILLGNGDGTFQTAIGYSVGNTPRSLTTGDFNGDSGRLGDL